MGICLFRFETGCDIMVRLNLCFLVWKRIYEAYSEFRRVFRIRRRNLYGKEEILLAKKKGVL